MLSKSLFRRNTLNSVMQTNMSLRYFAAMKEYDLAVIGGGPGGKYKFQY